jgi:hypothetical protein
MRVVSVPLDRVPLDHSNHGFDTALCTADVFAVIVER